MSVTAGSRTASWSRTPDSISHVLEAELQRYRKSILLVNFSGQPYWHEMLASLKHNIFPFTWNATKRVRLDTIRRFSAADSGILLTTLRSLESGVHVDANAVLILDVKFSKVNPEPMQMRLRDVYTRSSARSVAVYYFVPDLALDLDVGKFIRLLRTEESEKHRQLVYCLQQYYTEDRKSAMHDAWRESARHSR